MRPASHREAPGETEECLFQSTPPGQPQEPPPGRRWASWASTPSRSHPGRRERSRRADGVRPHAV